MRLSGLISLFILTISPNLCFAQFGTINFERLKFSYEFSDSSFNTSAILDKGVTINTDRGILRSEIPFAPIEKSFGFPLTKYLSNNSTAFLLGGLLDGEYDFEKNGEYHVIAKGMMNVNDSNKGRGYHAQTLIVVQNGVVTILITVPITSSDYGFAIDRIHVKPLVDEFTVTISGSVKL